MKFMKILTVFCLFLLAVAKSHNFKPVQSDEAVVGFVRNLLTDLNSKSSETHDVVLLRLGTNEETKQRVDDVFESLIQGIPEENPVTTPGVDEISGNKQMRKASLVIFVSDGTDRASLEKVFFCPLNSKFWTSTSKKLFITTETNSTRLRYTAAFMLSSSMLNFVIVSLTPGNFTLWTVDPFLEAHRFYQIVIGPFDIDHLFPDKLKDMNGVEYTAAFTNDYPFVYTLDDYQPLGVGLDFFRTILKHQNASLYFFRAVNGIPEIMEFFSHGRLDFALNTNLKNLRMETVNIYEVDGFCAMLPYPGRISFFGLVMKPFDAWTWVLILMTTACLTVVWYFLNKRSQGNPNSARYFLFSTVAFFIGQGTSFREHRLMQKVLIQLMILMTFILGNAYQSVIITLMTEAKHGEQISTIEEMVQSGFTYKVDPIFSKMIEKSDQYPQLISKMTRTLSQLQNLDLEKLANEKVGLIMTCQTMDLLYKKNPDALEIPSNAISYYYRLPERFYTFYKEFPMRSYSPFVERFREYSLRIFESGIKQHWMTRLQFEDMAEVKTRHDNANEEYLLRLIDMSGVFYILCFGYALSLLAFLVEIFWADCLSQLKWRMVIKVMSRVAYKKFKPKRHRIIQVQPINEV